MRWPRSRWVRLQRRFTRAMARVGLSASLRRPVPMLPMSRGTGPPGGAGVSPGPQGGIGVSTTHATSGMSQPGVSPDHEQCRSPGNERNLGRLDAVQVRALMIIFFTHKSIYIYVYIHVRVYDTNVRP